MQVERELQAERLAAEAQERKAKLAIEQQQQELHHIEEQAHKEVRSWPKSAYCGSAHFD